MRTIAMRTAGVVFLTSFAILFAVRVRDDGSGELRTCKAVGQSRGDGMSVTWGIPQEKCMAECSPTGLKGSTAYQAFMKAFRVSFNKLCECSANGETVVRFKPKDVKQAAACHDGTSAEIHEECWNMYKKARGTRNEQLGAMYVPRYKEPFLTGDFVVQRECRQPCVECNAVALPGALHGMSHEEKVALGQAIQKVMRGEEKDVGKTLKELIEILPVHDLDSAEFAVVDVDRDAKASRSELHNFYQGLDFTPKRIDTFIEAANPDEDETLDEEGFSKFKEEMRNFNPDVDLVNGETEFVEGDDGQIQEVQATWMPMCLKNGRPVDDKECAAKSKFQTQKAALEQLGKDC